ncbi:MAG: hypothetical protein ACRBHB_20735 [Arenicella sp.]
MAKKQLFSISSINLHILESEPPKLSVSVSGFATTTGWTQPELLPLEKKLSADGILDLDFVATPPSGISAPVMTPISAELIWEGDVERLIGVKVYSRSGDQIQLLPPAGGHASAAGPIFTTLAIGEEHPPTTLSIGEEGNPTTLRIGEEGNPTTLMFGEEAGPGPKPFFGETDPRVDDPAPDFDPNISQGFKGPFGRR